MKTCKKCNQNKPLSEFTKAKESIDGLRHSCRGCRKLQLLKWRENNEKHIKEYGKEYNLRNREDLLRRGRERYKRDKVKMNAISRDYYKKNRDEIIKRTVKNNINRYKIDLYYKFKVNLRKRLYMALKFDFKSGSAVRDLGCSVEFLKQYLESKFQLGMTWENYGKKKDQWSIDHIIPLTAFDLIDREQLLKACHYTNLQPMWHVDNIKKGNKLSDNSMLSLNKGE